MKDLRAPIAKARDEFLESAEGQKMCEGTASGQYLRNRIELAFVEGFRRGQSLAGESGNRDD